MKKLLHIAASPRIERSHSRKLATTFIDAFLAKYSDYEVETINVGTPPELMRFGKDGATAKFKSGTGGELTPAEKAEWDAARTEFERLASADRIVISTPMWNFSLPYHLKHYIDMVTQMGWSFTYDNGYKPLLPGIKTLVATASGGMYGSPETAPLDHLHPYLKFWTALVGLDAHFISIEGVNFDIRDAAIAKAAEAATAYAENF